MASLDNALKGGGARCSEVSSAVCRFLSFALALLQLCVGFAGSLLLLSLSFALASLELCFSCFSSASF